MHNIKSILLYKIIAQLLRNPESEVHWWRLLKNHNESNYDVSYPTWLEVWYEDYVKLKSVAD